MDSQRTDVKSGVGVALSWLLTLSLWAPGCDAGHVKRAIDSPDPLHAGFAKMPPAELGLPPDPMGDHKTKVETFAVPPPPMSACREFSPIT